MTRLTRCPVLNGTENKGAGDALTFRVQGLDLQLQGRVLQVELTGRGHDLNAMDEVNDGVAAQDLARGWTGGNRASDGRQGPGATTSSQTECGALTATYFWFRQTAVPT